MDLDPLQRSQRGHADHSPAGHGASTWRVSYPQASGGLTLSHTAAGLWAKEWS